MNFSVSSVQPVLGHLSQSAGNSQSAMGDSAIPPRKAVESDSFEKQSKPASGTVVPSVVTTAVLAPVLGVLAGEGTWQLGASDEKKSVSVPITAAELGTDGIPKPKVFDWANCEKDRPFYRTVKYIIETEQIPLINQSLGNDAEKATLEKHQFFQWLIAREKLFYTSFETVADVRNIIQKCLCITDFLIFSDSFPTSAKDSYDNFNPQYSDLQDFDTFQSHNRPWKAKLIQKYLAQQNLSSLEEFASLNKDLEDLAKICFDEDRETKIPNLNLGKVPDFEQEVFDRIQAGLKICKENAINNPQAPIHQTVETSVKEGVQSLEGLGNWVLKSTEALQKTGGEALEKHAITSRWIAGSVAAVTLLVGSGVAYTISKFKPEKPVTSNTR